MTRPRIVVPRTLPKSWMAPLREAAEVVAGPPEGLTVTTEASPWATRPGC